MAYSEKYRKRTIEYTLKEISEIFKVSESAIKSCIKQFKETGNLNKKPSGPRKHKKIDTVKLELYVKQYQDAYLYEMAEYFSCSIEEIRKALKCLNITRKKEVRYLEQDDKKVDEYKEKIKHIPLSKIAYVDETLIS